MGGPLKEFFVSLGLNADGASFASAQVMVDGLELALRKLVEWTGKAAVALGNAVVDTAHFAGNVDDASKMTGAAIESLQELQFAGFMSHLSAEEVTSSLGRLADRMREAASGSKEASAAFAHLGVRVRDAAGKMRAPEDVLNDLADAFVKMDPNERAGRAIELFGKSGQKLLPILLEGSSGIMALRDQARELGVVMSEDNIIAADNFGKSLERLQSVGQSMVREFTLPFIEALQPVVDGLLEWARENRGLVTSTLTRWGHNVAAVFVAIGRGAKTAAEVLNRIVAVVKVAVIAFVAFKLATLSLAAATLIANVGLGQLLANFLMNTIAATIFGGASVLAAAKAALAWAAAVAPLVLIAAAIGLVILALEDFYVFLNGGDSLIGHVLNRWWNQINAFVTKVRILLHMIPGFGAPLELAIAAGQQLALGVGDTLGAPPGQSAADTIWERAVTPHVGDFVSLGAMSPQAAAQLSAQGSMPSPWAPSVTRGRTLVNAPVNMTVVAAPGQSPVETAEEVVRRTREYLESELRKAQELEE